MTQPVAVPARSEKKSATSFFLWWRVEPAEVERQVAHYEILGAAHSARKGSAALCALIVVLTALVGRYLGMDGRSIAIEAAVWTGVGLAMLGGRRWAFMAGMLLWTFEKAFAILTGTSAGAPVVQVIWWTIYMHTFYTGYKVESARLERGRSRPSEAPAESRRLR
jgi:hypothetical protein